MTTLSPEQIKHSIKIELIKRYAKDCDILSWGKLLFPDKFPVEFCYELHDYFVEIAEEEFTSTMAPRGHAKSTIKCFLIPLFLGLNHPEKYSYYLNVQGTASKATDINIAFKVALEENELLHAIYGNLVGDKWTEKFIQLKNGVVFGAVGAGQSIRGINWLSKRPDYIVIDDLYDEPDLNNREAIEKKNDWVMSSLEPALAIGKKTCFHIQGTAFADYDILHATQKQDCYKFKKFCALKEDGTALWQVGIPLKKLLRKKQFNSIIFEREYQNEPRDDATAIIKTSWIRYANKIPENETVVEKLCGVDPSIGEKQINDATGISVVYKTLDENKTEKYYVMEVYNERISLNERVKLLKNLHVKHNFTIVFVESIAGFKDFTAELRRLTNLPIKEITRVKDKISTLTAKSHYFENSKVLINTEIQDKLKTELVNQIITNHPRHDDMRDAVLLCLKDIEMDKISIKIW